MLIETAAHIRAASTAGTLERAMTDSGRLSHLQVAGFRTSLCGVRTARKGDGGARGECRRCETMLGRALSA